MYGIDDERVRTSVLSILRNKYPYIHELRMSDDQGRYEYEEKERRNSEKEGMVLEESDAKPEEEGKIKQATQYEAKALRPRSV